MNRFLLAFIVLFSGHIYAQVTPQQTQALTVADAKKFLSNNDYKAALPIYLNILKIKPDDWEANLNAGICILNINGDRKKSLTYLDAANKLKPNNPLIIENLAKSLQFNERYYEARMLYKEIIPKANNANQLKYKIEEEYCKRAQAAINKPINVTFVNLGKTINSSFPDYYPIVPFSHQYMTFTSRRSGNTGNTVDRDGFFSSDIYISEYKNGKWQKPKNAGPKVNTIADEQVTGCNYDGKQVIIYIDHGGKNAGDLFGSESQKNFALSDPKNMGEKINSNAFESSGTYNAEGTLVVFSSKKEGSMGGLDLFYCNKLPNGDWSDPIHMGNKINSTFDEDFPWLSADGKTLTFSSNGHTSIGGFDIFISKWDSLKNEWSVPENIGYPINTSADELNLCLSENGEYGYMSCWREDSFGDLDIYKVFFNDLATPPSTFIYTTILAGDTIRPNVRANCIITDKFTNDTIGFYTTKKNGKFLMILPVGLYEMTVNSNGFEPYKSDLYVAGDEMYLEKDYKTIKLVKTPGTEEENNLDSESFKERAKKIELDLKKEAERKALEEQKLNDENSKKDIPKKTNGSTKNKPVKRK